MPTQCSRIPYYHFANSTPPHHSVAAMREEYRYYVEPSNGVLQSTERYSSVRLVEIKTRCHV